MRAAVKPELRKKVDGDGTLYQRMRAAVKPPQRFRAIRDNLLEPERKKSVP